MSLFMGGEEVVQQIFIAKCQNIYIMEVASGWESSLSELVMDLEWIWGFSNQIQ